MFTTDTTALVVIDIQERLLPHISGSETLMAKTATLIGAARILNIPMLVTEQYPEGIGPTVPHLNEMLAGTPVIAKRTFSCCREQRFLNALEALRRRQVLLCGIETHVCVFQTAADLVARGYQVQVAADAVSSRTAADKQIGLDRIRRAGGDISSVESALFELLETSARPEFKPVVKLIK